MGVSMTIANFVKKPTVRFAAFYMSVFAATFSIARTEINDYDRFQAAGYSINLPMKSNSTSITFGQEVEQLSERLVGAYGISKQRADRFSGWILEAEAYKNVPADLIATIIMTESSFRYIAVSSSGAVGPTQVKPKYWSSSCGNISNPRDNILCGAHVLAKYIKLANGNVKVAIKMYNVGPSNLQSNEYKEASDRYFGKVARHLAMLDNTGVVIR
jgi:soluble lytic murein transglycosylase-like protein